MFITILRTVMAVSHLAQADVYNEPYRPQVHFSPLKGWMNDPNGMVYYDGEYHLYFQHYPESADLGPIHWGHAVSRDLLHWTNLPTAFWPDEDGLPFSGSAIVDEKNVTGFQTSPQTKAIVAMYTRDINVEIETQHIWYSNDKGRSFEPYTGNPVIREPQLKDFRDPKVRNYKDGFSVPLAAATEIRFYKSKDLKSWEYTGSFGRNPDQGSHSGVWECPDLIPFDISGRKLWVLLVSINPGGPIVGSATQYFVGEFDGRNFTNLNPSDKIMWLDWGPDNYAGVTFEKTPKQDPILIAWASNWNYAGKTPTTKWRGQMAIPRTLKLELVNGEYRLKSFPIKELETLRTEKFFQLEKTSNNFTVNHREQVFHAEIEADIDSGLNITMGSSRTGKSVNIKLGTDGYIEVDRSNSGAILAPEFAKVVRGERISKKKQIAIDLVYDLSVIEIFFDKGLTSFTVLHFPEERYDEFHVSASTGTVKKADFFKLESIWKK